MGGVRLFQEDRKPSTENIYQSEVAELGSTLDLSTASGGSNDFGLDVARYLTALALYLTNHLTNPQNLAAPITRRNLPIPFDN